jgi:hypothetical protein
MLGHDVYTAAMTISLERDALFNAVYDTEHVPTLEKVPGVIGVRRYRRLAPPERFYLAVYEIEDQGVPSSAAWLEARDVGRWPIEVRPYTSGLQNGLFSRLAAFGGEWPAGSVSTNLLAVRYPDVNDVEERAAGVLAWLSHRADVTAAAYYRELAGRPHLLVAAIEGAGSDTAAELVRTEHGPANLEQVETYAPIGARRS